MTLQSRSQPSVRAEDYGRGNAVTFQYAEWTDNERRLNRIREDMMIKFWPRGIPSWLAKGSEPTPEHHGDNAKVRIIETLQSPMTCEQIAHSVGLSFSTVSKHLHQLKDRGIVDGEGHSRDCLGREKSRIWSLKDDGKARSSQALYKANSKAHEAITLKGKQKRRALLAHMDTPKTVSELASDAGVSKQNARDMLKIMLEAGKVIRIDGTKKKWVRA